MRNQKSSDIKVHFEIPYTFLVSVALVFIMEVRVIFVYKTMFLKLTREISKYVELHLKGSQLNEMN